MKNKIVLSSSLRIPDPSFLLGNPGLLINLPRSQLSQEQDHEEGWALKNWCFQTVVLEKTLKSLSDYKEIKPVNSKGNQHWIFTRRIDAEAEDSVLWPPEVKIWLIGKDPDAGKDWGCEEKGATKDEMVGWHRWLNGNGSMSKLWEIVEDGKASCAAVHQVTKSQTYLSDWATTITWCSLFILLSMGI